MTQARYSICTTDDATEMPRCFSISIQSEVACRLALRALTEPAMWIAPENSSSFSVSVVLPASGWEMMAKVRRRRTSEEISGMGRAPVRAHDCKRNALPPYGSAPVDRWRLSLPTALRCETSMYLPAHFEEKRPEVLHRLLRAHP